MIILVDLIDSFFFIRNPALTHKKPQMIMIEKLPHEIKIFKSYKISEPAMTIIIQTTEARMNRRYQQDNLLKSPPFEYFRIEGSGNLSVMRTVPLFVENYKFTELNNLFSLDSPWNFLRLFHKFKICNFTFCFSRPI